PSVFLCSIHQNYFAPCCDEFVDEFLPAHQAHGSHATILCKSDHRASNARIASILDDPIAWRELDEFTQKQRSCRWIDTKHGQLLRISTLRQREEIRGRQHDLLAPGGVGEWDKHTIPHLEIVNFLSHREDAPDAFAAKASGEGRQHA